MDVQGFEATAPAGDLVGGLGGPPSERVGPTAGLGGPTADQTHSGDQPVLAARKPGELGPGALGRAGLAQDLPVELGHLVRADHQGAREALGHALGLATGQLAHQLLG